MTKPINKEKGWTYRADNRERLDDVRCAAALLAFSLFLAGLAV